MSELSSAASGLAPLAEAEAAALAPAAVEASVEASATGLKLSVQSMLQGAAWTIGTFVLSQASRLLTNVALARLLAPELLGLMLLVNSLRTGIDLMSDVGIGQNIITHPKANEEEYYNTAWTMQLLRGCFVWLLCCLATIPLARLYDAPLLTAIMPVAGLYFILQGATSVSIFLAQKRFLFRRVNLFDLAMDGVSAVVHISLALILRNVWALIFAGLIFSFIRMAASYALVPGMRPRWLLSKDYSWQILSFGKWIFISTIVYYFATSFDRLYLARVAPLGLLGVYGIARTFADLVTLLVVRLSSLLLFPMVASSASLPRAQLRARLAPLRIGFLLLAAAGLGAFAALGDLPIILLYDNRYQQAGWMISILALGAWISILCSINETTLMGLRRPLYGAAANGFKLAWLVFGLPLAFTNSGTLGVIFLVAANDVSRYIPILVGQLREKLSFATQDAIATGVLATSFLSCQWLRWALHFGTSLDHIPALFSR